MCEGLITAITVRKKTETKAHCKSNRWYRKATVSTTTATIALKIEARELAKYIRAPHRVKAKNRRCLRPGVLAVIAAQSKIGSTATPMIAPRALGFPNTL